ncbi:MAG: phenylacetate--CoA ligase family protein [Thermodesulfobacteriota bacterium]
MSLCQDEHAGLSREDLEQLKLERMQATLHRIDRKVAFYRKRFRTIGFDPDKFNSLQDLERIPLTTEDDLTKAYPYEMFATPLKDVIRIHSTTGKSKDPIVLGLTERDLNNSSRLLARVMRGIGLGAEDVFQITLNYSLSSGAFAFHDAARELGASTIPASVGRTERQLKMLLDFGTSCLVATPGYSLILLEKLKQSKASLARLRLNTILLTGEPWPKGTEEKLREGFRAEVFDLYGLSAAHGPGIAAQCAEHRGLHVQEDLFHAEIIDPEKGCPLPHGQWGELVLTTLTHEAVPLLRYRTGDKARMLEEKCPCGLSFIQLDRISGRVDDVFICKGVNISPDRLNQILESLLGAGIKWHAEVEGQGAHQDFILKIGIKDDLFYDQMKKQRELVDDLRRSLAQWIGVTPRILLVEPESLPQEK